MSSTVILKLLGIGAKVDGEDDDIGCDFLGFEGELFLNGGDFKVIFRLQQFKEIKQPEMIVIMDASEVTGDEVLPQHPIKIGLNIQQLLIYIQNLLLFLGAMTNSSQQYSSIPLQRI